MIACQAVLALAHGVRTSRTHRPGAARDLVLGATTFGHVSIVERPPGGTDQQTTFVVSLRTSVSVLGQDSDHR